MFIITNERGQFLLDDGQWGYNRTEAMRYISKVKAEIVISALKKLFPCFGNCSPEVLKFSLGDN